MRKEIKRIGKLFPLLLSAMLLISGCGRSTAKNNMYAEETMAAAYAYYDEQYYKEAPQMEEGIGYRNSASAAGENLVSGAEAAQSDLNLDSVVQERKLIRNINVCLETEKYDTVNESIKNKVKEYGGYIENYSEYRGSYNYSSNRSSDITARIPADKADAFLQESFQDAFITSMSENTQDITLQYSDLETRLTSLITERDRLLELMKEAEDIESIIALEERMTQVRYELESIQSSLKNYDNKVDYSTVWISLAEVNRIEAPREASFIERIRTGFLSSTADLASALENFAVWFISNILSILLFAGTVFLTVKVILKLVRRSKEKNAGKTEKEEKEKAGIQKGTEDTKPEE